MNIPPALYMATLKAITKQYKAIARLQRIAMQNSAEDERKELMQDLDAMTEALESAISLLEKHANEQQRG